jgi:hypothetical protein
MRGIFYERSSLRFRIPSGAKQAAEKAEIWGETWGKHTSAAKAGADSIGIVPGINPPAYRLNEFLRGL